VRRWPSAQSQQPLPSARRRRLPPLLGEQHRRSAAGPKLHRPLALRLQPSAPPLRLLHLGLPALAVVSSAPPQARQPLLLAPQQRQAPLAQLVQQQRPHSARLRPAAESSARGRRHPLRSALPPGRLRPSGPARRLPLHLAARAPLRPIPLVAPLRGPPIPSAAPRHSPRRALARAAPRRLPSVLRLAEQPPRRLAAAPPPPLAPPRPLEPARRPRHRLVGPRPRLAPRQLLAAARATHPTAR
jgi:hypothetical protein